GRGTDADKLDDKERVRLRLLALDWLCADLEAQGHPTYQEPARAAGNVARSLQRWLGDPDFVGVRDPKQLAKLPPEEQDGWGRLWDEVAQQAARAHDVAQQSPGAAGYERVVRHADIARLREGVLSLRKARLGPDHSDTLQSKHDLAASHVRVGSQAHAARRYDEAIDAYRKAIELKPDYADAHYSPGSALRGKGQLDDAIAAYRKAAELKPDYAAAHVSLVTVLLAQGKTDAAAAEHREAVRHISKQAQAQFHSQEAQSRFDLGMLFYRERMYAQAEEDFQEAIRLKPENPANHFHIGPVLRFQNKLAEAIPVYRQAIQLMPHELSYRYALGATFQQQGKHPEAVAEFQQAVRIKPDDAVAHNNLGIALR